MKHLRALRVATSRRGMSMVEVILLIIAVLILLSLILPSIDIGRGHHARRLQCANNLKNLALAATNYASGYGGKLPLLSGPAPGLAYENDVIWVLNVFPYLDQEGAIEYINQATTPAAAAHAVNGVLSQSYRVLQCPLDSNHFQQPGGLSYGANIGYGSWRGISSGMSASYVFGARDHCARAIDWNRSGTLDSVDKDFSRATGVFWSVDADGFQTSLDDITEGDGSGQTVLFAESLNLTPMHLSGSARDGLNPSALDMGFGLGLGALGLAPQDKPSLFVERSAASNQQYAEYFKPNGKRDMQGGWPRAGSLHPGFVNVVFADGHVSVVDSNINWAVWASLHSPRGIQHGQVQIKESDF